MADGLEIQGAFDASIKDSNLQELSGDILELGIDSLLKDGLVRDVPIVGAISNLIRVGANIQDRLFLKKILAFLKNIKDISPEERKKIIDDIDANEGYRIKVGEKLLYIIDSCDDHETAEAVSGLFRACLLRQITYEDFLKAASVVKKISKQDLDWFTEARDSYIFDTSDVGDMIGSGLFVLEYDDIDVDVRDEDDSDFASEGSKYRTMVNGGVDIRLSRAGVVILEVFSSSYRNRKQKREKSA